MVAEDSKIVNSSLKSSSEIYLQSSMEKLAAISRKMAVNYWWWWPEGAGTVEGVVRNRKEFRDIKARLVGILMPLALIFLCYIIQILILCST